MADGSKWQFGVSALEKLERKAATEAGLFSNVSLPGLPSFSTLRQERGPRPVLAGSHQCSFGAAQFPENVGRHSGASRGSEQAAGAAVGPSAVLGWWF